MKSWIPALENAFADLLYVPPESEHLSILMGVALGTLFFFGKLVAVHVYGCRKGWIASFVGTLIPWVLVCAGLAAADLYLVDRIGSEALQLTARIAAGGILFLTLGVFAGAKFLDLSWTKSLLALMMIFVIVFSCVFLASRGLDAFSKGSKSVDRYHERLAE